MDFIISRLDWKILEKKRPSAVCTISSFEKGIGHRTSVNFHPLFTPHHRHTQVHLPVVHEGSSRSSSQKGVVGGWCSRLHPAWKHLQEGSFTTKLWLRRLISTEWQYVPKTSLPPDEETPRPEESNESVYCCRLIKGIDERLRSSSYQPSHPLFDIYPPSSSLYTWRTWCSIDDALCSGYQPSYYIYIQGVLCNSITSRHTPILRCLENFQRVFGVFHS